MLPHRALLGLALLAAGCGASAAGGPSPGAASPSPTSACAVQAATASGPVADPAGPYFHRVILARTDDGYRLREARRVLEHASVPDGARMPDGTTRIYYVNGAEGAVWVARVDGDEVRPVGPLRLDGVAGPGGVVDPDATALGDGRIRLAYLSGFGPPGAGSSRAICLADSEDGESFRVVGRALALSDENTTDPSLARLPDGTWLLALSRGQTTVLARSRDGLAFELGETLAVGGVPELSVLADGRLRLYVCARGIESHVSSDGGASWRREGTVVEPGTTVDRVVCDPSRVAGTDLFVYKTAD